MLMLIKVISFLFDAYTFLLLVRILASWLPQLHQYRLMQFVNFYTDPYLNFFRRFIPPLGIIDLSPIVAFICLAMLQNVIIGLLVGFVK